MNEDVLNHNKISALIGGPMSKVDLQRAGQELVGKKMPSTQQKMNAATQIIDRSLLMYEGALRREALREWYKQQKQKKDLYLRFRPLYLEILVRCNFAIEPPQRVHPMQYRVYLLSPQRMAAPLGQDPNRAL